MPYKSEKIKIEGTEHDKRIKLDDLQREDVKRLHDEGRSIRSLSREFKVDRNTIKCIVDVVFKEQFYKKNKERNKRYRAIGQYDNQYRASSTRKTRRHKQKLYIDGKITENDITTYYSGGYTLTPLSKSELKKLVNERFGINANKNK